MDVFLAIISIILIIVIGLMVYYLRQFSHTFHTTLQQVQNADEKFDKSQLTSYELERLEREEEFDKRIERLKEELAEQQQIIRRGVTAEELHPLVKNLPHNTVQTKYDVLPDVEIAD